MRRSEDIIQTKYNSQRTRENNNKIIDSQLKQIREKLNDVLFCYEDTQLEALENIYRNLGKALEIINSNKEVNNDWYIIRTKQTNNSL